MALSLGKRMGNLEFLANYFQQNVFIDFYDIIPQTILWRWHINAFSMTVDLYPIMHPNDIFSLTI